MQKTRESIVQILKRRGYATVDELSQALELTSVTVRHHLEILRQEGIVDSPQPLRRPGPGRPQHLYRLTEDSAALFPKKYDLLAREVLRETADYLSAEEMDMMLERIAQRVVDEVDIPPGGDFSARLDSAIEFLNEMGFMAFKGEGESGRTVLHISNCPYQSVAQERPEPCTIDSHIISYLLGDAGQGFERIFSQDGRCTYAFVE